MVQSAIHYHLSLIGAFSKFPSDVAEKLFLRENRPHKTFESLVIFSDVDWIFLAETKKSIACTLFPWAGKEIKRFLQHLCLSGFLLLNHFRVFTKQEKNLKLILSPGKKGYDVCVCACARVHAKFDQLPLWKKKNSPLWVDVSQICLLPRYHQSTKLKTLKTCWLLNARWGRKGQNKLLLLWMLIWNVLFHIHIESKFSMSFNTDLRKFIPINDSL